MAPEVDGRSAAQVVSWRAASAILATILVFALTGRIAIGLAVGALHFLVTLVLSPLYERLWRRPPANGPRPVVLWLTGLSGAGKSTISARVATELRARGLPVEQLDGDSIRDIFPNTGFSKADRDAHIRRVGYLASKLEQHGVFVVVSLVSPYRESRDFVRGLCQTFVEVYLATPIEECERRDVKGLYAKARRGEIRNFTGIDDPYEPPTAPDLAIDTTGTSVEDVNARIFTHLRSRGIAV